MRHHGKYRRIVLRGGRRFVVCGLARRPAPPAELKPLPFGWTLRATVLVAALIMAYVAVRPPAVPTGPQGPALSFTRYSIDDFANARH